MTRRLVLLSLLLLGCAGEPTRSPVDVLCLTPAGLAPRRILTLESLTAARGGVTEILRGDGEPVELAFFEDDGLYVPADAESLVWISFYAHLEWASERYQQTGVDVTAMLPLPTYVQHHASAEAALLFDNAAYVDDLRGFVLGPQFYFHDTVPPAANPGLVAHELAHAVLAHVTDHADAPPAARYHFGGVNEGIADAFAAFFTGDPAYLEATYGESARDRDASVRRVYTAAPGPDIYLLGAVVSSTMWELGGRLGRDRAAALLLEAVRALRGAIDADFRVTVFLDRVAAAAHPDEIAAVCAVLRDHFAVLEIERCR